MHEVNELHVMSECSLTWLHRVPSTDGSREANKRRCRSRSSWYRSNCCMMCEE